MTEQALFSFFHVGGWGEMAWVGFGLFGQLLFSARFLLQWIASEKAKRSVMPEAFWYFSLAGGIVLFAYALYRTDPVFILGQFLGVFIYSRNLWLLHAEKRQSRAAAVAASSDRDEREKPR